MALSEILAVLADEMAELNEVVNQCVSGMLSTEIEEEFSECAEIYGEQLSRIASVSEILELPGLAIAAEFVQDNLNLLKFGEPYSADKLKVFSNWPKLVIGYLQVPKEGVYSQEMADYFKHEDWLQPLDDEQAAELNEELLVVTTMDEKYHETDKQRQVEALPEDTSLLFPEDINPLLYEAFIAEGPIQALEFSELVQKFGTGQAKLSDVDQVRRVIHNVKGSANTVTVRGVATLAHHVEDILDYCYDNAYIPDGDLQSLLIEVADVLEMMYEAILDGHNNPPEQALTVLQIVLDLGNQIDHGEFDIGNTESSLGQEVAASTMREANDEPAVKNIDESEGVIVASQSAKPADKSSLKEATAPPQEIIKPAAKIRISLDSVDEMLRHSGEIAISRSHTQERLQQANKILADYRERDETLWERINQLDELVTTQGIEAVKRQNILVGDQSDMLDPLEMDQYSEVHTQIQLLIETAADLKMLGRNVAGYLSEIDSSLREVTLVNNDLHQLIMTTRMVPASTLEHRLNRTVRQAANQVGKQVVLNFNANDVMLDDQMINHLVDPLQHMLRNAVIHGIENTEIRENLNKPEQGTITLTFERDGNYLNINCEDDGQGLDTTLIYKKAISNGIILKGESISETEIERLILQPGFSIASEITEMAGRGVGMDVVNTNIRKLKGFINIINSPNAGVKFNLRMPMTLGIVHSLLVTVNEQVFAVSANNLDRIVYDGTQHVKNMSDQWYFHDDMITCPIYEFSELLHFQHNNDFATDEVNRPVILVNDINGPIALAVDSVIVGRDLVLKNLGSFVGTIDGILGSSILGDGAVVYILEPVDLIKNFVDAQDKIIDSYSVPTLPQPQSIEKEERSKVLVVDDSLSTRTALSIMLTDNGYSVNTANDGMDAIDSINTQRPGVVLVDMEMPRMDGLELTSHIRSRAEIKNMPILMITSRTSQKHRKMAEKAGVDIYITKPFVESELLNLIDSTLSADI